MNNCLYCYETLATHEIDYHAKCVKHFFGISNPPEINFGQEELDSLAKNLINRSEAVTGVQPKLSLSIEKVDPKQYRLTIVGVLGKYIMKPQTAEFEEVPENEDLIMKMANMLGIKTAEHTLFRLKSGELAYLTKRFDRKKTVKIHQIDFCQLSENLTEHKYRGSIEKVGKVLRQYASNPGYDCLRLFELTIFNYLIGNSDMHLKNFSLINDPKIGWTLSPAYDLLSTQIILKDDLEETALTINGKRNKIKKEDFIQLGITMGINQKVILNVLSKMYDRKADMYNLIRSSFLSEGKKEELSVLIAERQNRIQ